LARDAETSANGPRVWPGADHFTSREGVTDVPFSYPRRALYCCQSRLDALSGSPLWPPRVNRSLTCSRHFVTKTRALVNPVRKHLRKLIGVIGASNAKKLLGDVEPQRNVVGRERERLQQPLDLVRISHAATLCREQHKRTDARKRHARYSEQIGVAGQNVAKTTGAVGADLQDSRDKRFPAVTRSECM
jgi:hypothetical protein